MPTPESFLLAYFRTIGESFPSATDGEVYAIGLIPGLVMLIVMLAGAASAR